MCLADKFPESLPAFQKMFPDDGACALYLESIRWPSAAAAAEAAAAAGAAAWTTAACDKLITLLTSAKAPNP